jgi:ribonuclease HI
VKCHIGHALNKQADKLATSAAAGKNVDENGRVTRFPPGLKF